MIERLRRLIYQDEGFTLIELLIVIIILGILAAIVVFGVSTFRDDANEKACIADRKSVEVAAQAYLAKTGSQASAESDLTGGGYLKSAPTHSYGGWNFSFATGTVTACTKS